MVAQGNTINRFDPEHQGQIVDRQECLHDDDDGGDDDGCNLTPGTECWQIRMPV